ncbi:LytR/AlgR family response regulator transcription factor [Parapedobacter tibetensis]|uniref:LytR/AlgR family response regulator transcription factor n=1 Tax=Parapedobacter tibetensis TaxID=2972951 RepID=UPI00214D1F33|nr:LytTR family DNA-binding domain-containing protein [Parapedobacter tibetensis]
MNCIIIEDQAPAQRILKKYIQEFGSLDLKESFADPIAALDYLKSEKTDLIFLDIHLPKISGVDFLNTLKHSPKVIITTAFSDYAVRSYEFDVADYLLKPFSFERFVKAVNKAMSVTPQPVQGQGQRKGTDFFVKSGYEYYKINSNDIIYIGSDMDYTELHLGDRKHLTTETLQNWEEKLRDHNFYRVHKSFLVNLSKVKKISGNMISLEGDHNVPIGRSYKDFFVSRFLK